MSDPHSAHADLNMLGTIAGHLTDRNLTVTRTHIQRLLDVEMDEEAEHSLRACFSAYNRVSIHVTHIIMYWTRRKASMARQEASGALRRVAECQAAFTDAAASPLAGNNNVMEKLLRIVVTICDAA
uniref:Uncharacterized protein n=1 Tax=Kalanchoe fedtschenkoi TaxID=63787 RepID=A0A7N0U6S6_KALFE